MDSVLLRVLRARLQSQSDDELLKFWIDNDRQQYSPEAFEAARLILIERNIPVPEQNAPLPHADQAQAIDVADEYWLKWIRPFFYLGLVIAISQFAPGFLWFCSRILPDGVNGWRNRNWNQWEMIEISIWLGLPILLFVALKGAMKLAPRSRLLLQIYCWLRITVSAYSFFNQILRPIQQRNYTPDFLFIMGMITSIGMDLSSLAYPIMLLLLLKKPEIQRLFHPANQGFEPISLPPATAPTNPD